MTSDTSGNSKRFAVFCKTFGPDIDRFARLLDSFEMHNPSGLRLFVSIPRADRDLFHQRLGTGRFETMYDEDVLTRKVRRGWRAQQLVKLYAGLTGFADAWLWVDSDCYFTRDFDASHFVRDGQVAFICSQLRHIWDDKPVEVQNYIKDARSLTPVSKELLAQWGGTGRLASSFRVRCQGLVDWLSPPAVDPTVDRIRAFFGRGGDVLEYMPCAVWTRESLVSLDEQILKPRGWSFYTLIGYAPWEAIWVGEWELFRGSPGRYFIEPPLLHIRSDAAILGARAAGITERIVSQRYLGLQLAARHQELDGLEPSAAESRANQ